LADIREHARQLGPGAEVHEQNQFNDRGD